jgi:glycosyltransferase involved in cell wall biosynthesis
MAIRRAAFVFVENTWMERLAIRELGPNRVLLAPPGVDTGVFSPAPTHGHGHLLCVARLNDPRKNIRLLIHAYQEVVTAMPTAPPLVLAGYSDLGTAEKSLINSFGMKDRIIVRRNPSHEDLLRLYQAAYLLLLGSNEEGLGMVLLEAASCGVPAIATRCGGPEIIIEDGVNGLLIPVGDVGAMSRGIRLVLLNPALQQRMGAAARRRVELSFSIEAAGQRFIDVYRELLKL